jgi:hypothetical protein
MGREKDRRQFEKTREVREEQTRNISEEDRRQWEKTRDMRKEAHERPRREDQER